MGMAACRNPGSRTRFMNEDELTRLKNVMASEDWDLVAFAIKTGLRQGEQFTLRWDCVDLENGVLTLSMPKGGKTRHVPLSEGAKEILRPLNSFRLLVHAPTYRSQPAHYGRGGPCDSQGDHGA